MQLGTVSLQNNDRHIGKEVSSTSLLLLQRKELKQELFLPLFSLHLCLHRNNHPIMMETPPKCKLSFTLIFCIFISHSLGLVSFTLCIASETKRNKKGDLRWNGKLCHLPSSPAFGLSVASLICLVLSQIIGNSILFRTCCSGGKRIAKFEIPFVARILLLISWLSFGIAVILLIVATSMSRRQTYGEGWLNGECYLVKGGIYVGLAILIIVSVESLMGSALLTMKTNDEADQGNKIHAQTERIDT